MIRISTYNNYWQSMIARVPALKQAYLVANEAQLGVLVTKSDIACPLLIATIPSADPDSRDADSLGEKNTALIFVLSKIAAADRTGTGDIALMDTLQNAIEQVKLMLIADFTDCSLPGHSLMQRLDLQSMHTDPEYNYLGHDGWSLSFKFTTLGV